MKKWRQHVNKPPFWLLAAIFWFIVSCVVDYFARWRVDAVTGIAFITLLVMVLQSEHERCERLRDSWRNVRGLTLALTSAIQRAQQKKDRQDAERYLEETQTSLQKLYAGVLLLYGKNPLREEYRKRMNEMAEANASLTSLLTIFPELDGKAERMIGAWTLRLL
jgi:hypothetical protein